MLPAVSAGLVKVLLGKLGLNETSKQDARQHGGTRLAVIGCGSAASPSDAETLHVVVGHARAQHQHSLFCQRRECLSQPDVCLHAAAWELSKPSLTVRHWRSKGK